MKTDVNMLNSDRDTRRMYPLFKAEVLLRRLWCVDGEITYESDGKVYRGTAAVDKFKEDMRRALKDLKGI